MSHPKSDGTSISGEETADGSSDPRWMSELPQSSHVWSDSNPLGVGEMVEEIASRTRGWGLGLRGCPALAFLVKSLWAGPRTSRCRLRASRRPKRFEQWGQGKAFSADRHVSRDSRMFP